MQVNAELYRAMGEIADDKVLMEKVLAFVKSLIQKQKKARKNDDDKRLDAALAKFSSDWGGDGTPQEIAEDLRQGIVNSRTVEEW
jgi:hypothetical protein